MPDATMKKVVLATDVPKEPHYAVYKCKKAEASTYGSGTPASTEHFVTTDKAVWEKTIDNYFMESPKRDDIVAVEVGRVCDIKVVVHID